MEMEYFLFALMIFGMGMVIAVLFLIFRGGKKDNAEKRKDQSALEDQEKKVMLLYFEVEDMLNSLKEYISHTDETIRLKTEKLEALADTIYLKSTLDFDKMEHIESDAQSEAERKESKAVLKDEDLHKKIMECYRDGKAEDEIAEKYRISRSEVRFIIKLYGK